MHQLVKFLWNFFFCFVLKALKVKCVRAGNAFNRFSSTDIRCAVSYAHHRTYYAKIHLSATLFNMNWNGTASYTTIFFFAYEWIFSCIVLTPTRTDEWVNKANENWGSVEEKRDSKHGRRQKSRKRIIKKKDPEWMKQKTTQRHRITSNNYR